MVFSVVPGAFFKSTETVWSSSAFMVLYVHRNRMVFSVVPGALSLQKLYGLLLLWCFKSTETVWLTRDGGRMG